MKKSLLFNLFRLMKHKIMRNQRHLLSAMIAGVFLFIYVGSGCAEQALKSEEFLKAFPKGKNTSWFRGITKIGDGYAICGGIQESKGKTNWAYVIHIDDAGNTIWERELGKKARNANFHKVVVTRDKKLVLGGIVNSAPQAKWEAGLYSKASAWIVKLTADGNVEWDRTFRSDKTMPDDVTDKPTKSVAWAENVIIEQNDELIVLGNNQRGGADVPAVWKIGTQGNLIWNNTFKREDDIWANVLFPFSQTVFVAGGTAFNPKTKEKNVWLIMVNDRCDTLWEKKLKGKLFTATTYSNDRIIIAGSLDDEIGVGPGHKSSARIWLSEIDRLGNVKSMKYIEDPGLCDITNIWITADKEIFVIGNTCESERERIWAGRFILSSNLSSIKKYLPLRNLWMNDAIPDGPEGFIAVGSAYKGQDGSQSAWVLKTKFSSDKYR